MQKKKMQYCTSIFRVQLVRIVANFQVVLLLEMRDAISTIFLQQIIDG